MDGISLENEDTALADSAKLDIRPFRHQVSGHVGMLQLGADTILKPATGREAAFYASVPPALRPFTAQFQGILKVEVGNFAGLLRRASLRSSQGGSCVRFEASEGNPWGLRFQRQLLKDPAHSIRFLKLENLVRGYARPCILDLKMGTQQFGPWASEEKKRSKRRRSLATTSGRLGIRLINKQVFSPATGFLAARSKDLGRALREESLGEEIRSFVAASNSADLIAAFISKLSRLQEEVAKAEGHRFFCSSLLLIYDGADLRPELCQVRMIDFAQWAGPAQAAFEGPDDGYLLGLRNLRHFLRKERPESSPSYADESPDEKSDSA